MSMAPDTYKHESLPVFVTKKRQRIHTPIFCHLLEFAHYEIQIQEVFIDPDWTGDADGDEPYVIAIGWEEIDFYHEQIEAVFSICNQLNLNLLSCNLEFFAADGKVRYSGSDYMKGKIK